MKPQQENTPEQSFERMPYPLEAPQDAEKVLTEMLPEDTTAVLARLLDDLSDLVANWKVTAHGERRKLGATHPPHDVPMEFRAGRAEGLENAAHDVEMALAKIGR